MLGNHVTISEALTVTVVCMVTVFTVLFVLSLIMQSFKYFLKEPEVTTQVKKNSIDDRKTDIEKNSVISEYIDVDKLECDEDIVAGIAASIAASSGKKNSRIHIRSIKRIQ